MLNESIVIRLAFATHFALLTRPQVLLSRRMAKDLHGFTLLPGNSFVCELWQAQAVGT